MTNIYRDMIQIHGQQIIYFLNSSQITLRQQQKQIMKHLIFHQNQMK